MAELRLDFDWEEAQGACGPELRASWARFQLNVDSVPVTRAFHPESKTVRDYVYLPLYPLAEWIAVHWWRLFYDSKPHNVRLAREGFCLPDLEFLPLGETIQLVWHQTAANDWPVRFMESGAAILDRDATGTELSRMLEAVIERLALDGISDTLLSQEWLQIQKADAEEKEFCRAAAALGLDPLEVTREQENDILEAHDRLGESPSLEDEFFHAASLDRVATQLRQLEKAKEQLHATENVSHLPAITLEPLDIRQAPWDRGYLMARELRNHLGIQNKVFRGFGDLAQTISSNGGPSVIDVDAADLFDALTLRERNGGTAFALASSKGREVARIFAFCRALGELVEGTQSTGSEFRLVTASQTERQKRNRAFAAEFLAPAELLKARLPSEIVSPELVDDLAEEFTVSPLLIEHQLDNHRLARVRS